jgi:hypothetical protein
MKDKKLYTFFWLYQVRLPQFLIFLTLGRSLARTRYAINVNCLPKFPKFNNLSKTGLFVEIFHQEPKKMLLGHPKKREILPFFGHFSN